MTQTLSEFVFVEDTARKGATLILQTSYPYLIGKVWRYEALDWNSAKQQMASNLIADYRMAVFHDGEFMPLDRDARNEVQYSFPDIFKRMCQFYKENRIEPNKPRFRRYLITED